MYRYISRESCSQFDSLPLTSWTPRSSPSKLHRTESIRRASEDADVLKRRARKIATLNRMGINQRSADQPCAGGVVEMRTKIVAIRGVDFSRFIHREMDGAAFGTVCADRRAATGLPPRLPIRDGTVSLDAERDAFEAKRRVLLELVAFVNGGPSLEQRDILDVLTIALEVIDRAAPPPERAPLDPANPESVHSDMMWTHVSLGYELLLRLLYHPRMTKAALQPLLNKPRLRGLLARFMTSDARERDYVKTAVFRAYAILVGRRMFIRRHIRTLLTNFVATESEKCAAVLGVRPSSVSDTPAVTAFFGTIPLLGEVIEFCCSIAAGLNVPLKAEHKAFLRDNLLPLHTCSAYPTCVLSAACCVCVCWSQGRRRRTRPLRWRPGSRFFCVSLCSTAPRSMGGSAVPHAHRAPSSRTSLSPPSVPSLPSRMQLRRAPSHLRRGLPAESARDAKRCASLLDQAMAEVR